MQLGKAKKHANFYDMIEKVYCRKDTPQEIIDIAARRFFVFYQGCASFPHKHPLVVSVLCHFYGGFTFVNSD